MLKRKAHCVPLKEYSKVVSLVSLGCLTENDSVESTSVDCENMMDGLECQADVYLDCLFGTLGTLQVCQSLANIQKSVLLAES